MKRRGSDAKQMITRQSTNIAKMNKSFFNYHAKTQNQSQSRKNINDLVQVQVSSVNKRRDISFFRQIDEPTPVIKVH